MKRSWKKYREPVEFEPFRLWYKWEKWIVIAATILGAVEVIIGHLQEGTRSVLIIGAGALLWGALSALVCVWSLTWIKVVAHDRYFRAYGSWGEVAWSIIGGLSVGFLAGIPLGMVFIACSFRHLSAFEGGSWGFLLGVIFGSAIAGRFGPND